MTKICDAMREAGIADPESKEGIDFCISSCPYEEGCILLEPNIFPKKHEATNLCKLGYSSKAIADILGVHVITVNRHLGDK